MNFECDLMTKFNSYFLMEREFKAVKSLNHLLLFHK